MTKYKDSEIAKKLDIPEVEVKRYRIKNKFIQDLKDGVTGDGSYKGKKTVPGLKYGKNPWVDLLREPEDQEMLVKILGNYGL